MVPSLSLMSRESTASVKENRDGKKMMRDDSVSAYVHIMCDTISDFPKPCCGGNVVTSRLHCMRLNFTTR